MVMPIYNLLVRDSKNDWRNSPAYKNFQERYASELAKPNMEWAPSLDDMARMYGKMEDRDNKLIGRKSRKEQSENFDFDAKMWMFMRQFMRDFEKDT